MSQHCRNTGALLGQGTASVALNKVAVAAELDEACERSARVNFRGLQGVAVSIPVTTAEPRCLTGRHAVTPAAADSAQEA